METSEDEKTPDWVADEMLRHAEAAGKARIDALNKTKDRATSLLGWAITITAAAVAYTAKFYSAPIGSWIATAVIALGFYVAAMLAAKVLQGVPFEQMTLWPHEIEEKWIDRKVTCESEMKLTIADELAMRTDRNALAHEQQQRFLKAAWTVSIVTVPLSLLFGLAFN